MCICTTPAACAYIRGGILMGLSSVSLVFMHHLVYWQSLYWQWVWQSFHSSWSTPLQTYRYAFGFLFHSLHIVHTVLTATTPVEALFWATAGSIQGAVQVVVQCRTWQKNHPCSVYCLILSKPGNGQTWTNLYWGDAAAILKETLREYSDDARLWHQTFSYTS